MRTVFLAAAIAAAVVMPLPRAEAMTPGASVSAAAAKAAKLELVVNVCGSAGCAPVQTKRYTRPPKPGSVAAHHI